jgi:hypothetical protein
MNSQSTTASPKVVAAVALFSAAVLTAFTFGGSSSANAQAPAPVAASGAADSGASLHDGVDWSRVAVVPASPAQSVAAYDR